jgi:hypothetical protein
MTDAAIADGDLSPTENIEDAVEDSQEPEQGETSEAPEAEEPSSEETAEKVEEEKAKKRNSVQERISQLARQKNDANAKVQDLEQQVAYLQSQYQQPQEAPTAYPRLEDYDYDENRHQQAVLEYTTKQNAQTVQQAITQQQQAQIAQINATKQNIANEEFVARSNDFSIDYPDFAEKVSSADFHQSDFVAQKIVDLDNGPAVAYFLANNKKFANAINQKNDMDAYADLIRISTALHMNARRKSAATTNAPAPSKTVSPKGKVAKDPDKMTPDEYRKYRGYTK